jgi:hypothetical protein
MNLEEALQERELAKHGLLDARKAVVSAEQTARAAAKYARERVEAVPKAERRYLEAVAACKALLDADVSGVMGKPKSEPSAASAVEAHP